MVIVAPTYARSSMFLRPNRSASDPQNGDEMKSIAPVAVASTPDQSAAPESVSTPRSFTKNGRNGKTRFAPIKARNCDTQTAYRFFSQVSSFTRGPPSRLSANTKVRDG